MSDDLNKKIKQITDVLGQEKLPENLMGLLNLLASSSSGEKEDSSQKSADPPAFREEKPEKNDQDDGTDMVRKMARFMGRVSAGNDPRINLLRAITPFMGGRRQKKIANCINLLRMSSMASLLDDNDKGSF